MIEDVGTALGKTGNASDGSGAFRGLPAETWRTGGKINLFLRVTGRRADGYHELSTLFLPLPEPCDTLVIRPAAEDGGGKAARPPLDPVVRCDTAGINPRDNTILKVWRRYADATGFAPALEVELVKGIPHGAGLGGGSADAALMLRYLQRHCPGPLPADRLRVLAAGVGADVPFFLEGRPCLAEGIGEKLTPCGEDSLRPLRDMWIVLLCPTEPEVRVGTAWAFAALDEASAQQAGADASAGILPLTGRNKADNNHHSCFQRLFGVENDFEPVVFAVLPQLARLKASLLREGAAAAGMSGSGSSLFGLFRGEDSARSAASRLERTLAGTAFVVHGPMALLKPL